MIELRPPYFKASLQYREGFNVLKKKKNGVLVIYLPLQ